MFTGNKLKSIEIVRSISTYSFGNKPIFIPHISCGNAIDCLGLAKTVGIIGIGCIDVFTQNTYLLVKSIVGIGGDGIATFLRSQSITVIIVGISGGYTGLYAACKAIADVVGVRCGDVT